MSKSKKQLENTTSRRRFLTRGAAVTAAAVSLPVLGKDEPRKQPVTIDTLSEAEKIFGLEYTDQENQQMLEAINNQLDKLNELRAIEQPNSLAQAMTFDPRLSYVDYGYQDNKVTLSSGHINSSGKSDEDIAYASIQDQAAWLRLGHISSERLTNIYLERIKKYGNQLECFVTVTADTALKQARHADRELKAGIDKGPLHGIPYGLKDLFDTEGIKTTWGATPFKDRTPEADATVVKLLNEAGAVMLGKTTCGALASGDVWYDGKTRNPWHTKEGSSGSSAGSASATAAGLVGFSIGTETLGSIVSPSNRCGATGLRPTYGRISRAGAMALCWSLDKVGPICRTVEDTVIVLAVLNKPDPQDTGSIAMGFEYSSSKDLSNITVGYDPVWFSGDKTVQSDIEALNALKALGLKTKEISIPDTWPDLLRMALSVESAAAFEELTLADDDDQLRRQLSRAWPTRWRQARLLSAVDYVQLDRLRRQAMDKMHILFEDIDMLIAPNFASGLLVTTNYTGHPCLTLRAGFHKRELVLPGGPYLTDESLPKEKSTERFELPRNISLMGRLFSEGVLCAVGRKLEEKLNVKNQRPNFLT